MKHLKQVIPILTCQYCNILRISALLEETRVHAVQHPVYNSSQPNTRLLCSEQASIINPVSHTKSETFSQVMLEVLGHAEAGH